MKTILRSARILVIVLILIVAYLAFWPIAAAPGIWTPLPAPALSGDYAVNDALKSCQRLATGVGRGPEDVAFDAAGQLYAGYEDGRIMRFQADGSAPTLFANTGGRPLGLEFTRQGELIVCDSTKGLLSISTAGAIEVLATEQGGRPFRFCDDVAIASDGTIYFTDASSKFGQQNYVDDIVEHRPNGRLLAYHPEGKSTELLLDNLYFANGVAVAPGDEFILAVETGAYRVLRLWLRGPKQGQAEVFINNLPGFPDGIATGLDGRFWIALAAPRDPLLDAFGPFPRLRGAVLRLPRVLQPKAKPYGFALAVDAGARVLENLQDPEGGFAPITNVVEREGYLYLGSLEAEAIGRVAYTKSK